MNKLTDIHRVTIYAESLVEKKLLDACIAAGATGYTVIDCRGAGKTQVVDNLGGEGRVRIELLVRPETAQKILTYLRKSVLKKYAVTIAVESVQVPNPDDF